MTDSIGTAQLQLWNDLVSMIEQWEDDGADSPGDLARKIIAKVQQPIGTAQERELIERARNAKGSA